VYYEEVSVKKKRIFFYNLARYASERVNMGFCPTETLFEWFWWEKLASYVFLGNRLAQ